MAWYYLVFTAIGLAATTFAAIMTHIPRIPEQRGLLAVIIISGIAAVFALLLTQLADPLKGIEVSPIYYQTYFVLMLLVLLAALADLVYFVQAQRRHLDGAVWSLVVALGLIACGTLGLLAQAGIAH